MKVTVPKKTKKTYNGFVSPQIPLNCPSAKELEKDDYVILKLKSVPRSASSAEYSLNIPPFLQWYSRRMIEGFVELEASF